MKGFPKTEIDEDIDEALAQFTGMSIYDVSPEIRRRIRTCWSRVFGSMKATRGKLDGREVYQFDVVPRCPGETCEWHGNFGCPFGGPEEGKPCKVLRHFLSKACRVLYEQFNDLPSDIDFMKIGMSLLPLYTEKFIILLSIRSTGALIKSPRGGVTSNPLYKDLSRIENDILKLEQYLEDKLRLTEPTVSGRNHNPRFGQSNSHANRLMG